jgi:hypothetical protein
VVQTAYPVVLLLPDEARPIRAGFLLRSFVDPKIHSRLEQQACLSRSNLEDGQLESNGLSAQPVQSSEDDLPGWTGQSNQLFADPP